MIQLIISILADGCVAHIVELILVKVKTVRMDVQVLELR